MGMILSAHQPAYMPWPGYLERIAMSDVFVVLTGVQFEKNSFTNRNKIMLDGREQWLTVPLKLKGHMDKPITAIEVDRLKPWRQKHLNMIRHAYAKASRFKENWPKIEDLYDSFSGKKLFMEVFARNFTFWMKEYGLSKKLEKVVFNSARSVQTDELIGLCKWYEATTYLSGPLGRDYLDLNAFGKEGIKVIYDDSPQEPLSILDSWMKSKENPFSS